MGLPLSRTHTEFSDYAAQGLGDTSQILGVDDVKANRQRVPASTREYYNNIWNNRANNIPSASAGTLCRLAFVSPWEGVFIG